MAGVARTGLTEQQHRAVTARGVSVALSAGAGCGKTYVLTERFLSHIEPAGADGVGGARLGELVAITFTERAAREMRDRIRRACRQRLLECPDAQAEHWLGLFRQLDAARISTIHAFCNTLLRTFAVEAGLDPQFRVLPQAQSEMLLYEVIDDQLRDRLSRRDEAAIELVVEFGLEPLRRMVAVLLGRRQDIDWAEWSQVNPDQLVARWQTFWQQVVAPAVLKRLAESADARAVLEIVREHRPTHAVMSERCRILADSLQRLAASSSPRDELEAIRQNARVQSGGGKGAWPSAAVYERFRDAAARLRKAAEAAADGLTFEPDVARSAAEAGLHVLEIASGVHEAYFLQKQQWAALDFDDLLIHAKGLLTDPAHRNLQGRIASGIRLLLVDEFQDTDPLQVELVEALAGGELMKGKLFFVGDYKQSIYRFRGADPQVFRRLREATPSEGRLPLTQNFRSQPAILQFVNALFWDDLGPEYEPLVASRPQLAPEPAIELLWAADTLPDQRTGQKDRLRRLEADWIARRVRGMLDSGETLVWDEEAARRGTPALRPLRQGDVALLFRALSDVQYYEEALRRYEIDYYLVGGHAFYAQQEIYDLLNLLRAVASPGDEVSLAGVLRSPFFSLEDETLLWLAQHTDGLRGGLLAEEPPAEVSRDQRARVRFAASVVSELVRQKDCLPVAELIQLALDRTGYDAVVLAEFLGERKLANLRKLVDQARSLDRMGVFSLWDFITQLAEFVARQPDEPLAATQAESTDVVRLMTIHQSKGLEFPVVIVPDMDRRMQGPVSPAAFSRELGPLVKTAGLDGYQLHAMAGKDEEAAEIVRLLYVATTRAADRLILAGGVPELGASGGPWTELLARRFDPLTGALRASLPAGHVAPKISVITTEPPVAQKAATTRQRSDLDKLVDDARRAADEEAHEVPWLQPIPPDADLRVYSFSRLTGRLGNDRSRPPGEETWEAAPQRSDDSAEEAVDADAAEIDPLDLGNLVHAVLADIDFQRPDEVEALVQRHVPWHLPGAADEVEVAVDMIRRFVQSPRAQSLAAAREVYRELDFLLAWPPGTQDPQPAYLQGAIDCLYQDADGRWRLLDYKTHRVDRRHVPKVAAAYEAQAVLYGLAVQQILGEPPEELVLCFLRPGVEQSVAWSDTTVQQVIRQISEAIGERD